MKNKIYKILVVDDSELARKEVINDLKPLNAEFLESGDGRHAIITALKEKPDLITLDVEMPKMNGFDVAKQLRKNKLTQSIPIIIVTCHTTNLHFQEGFEAGVADYFSKPFVKGELFRYVSQLFCDLETENLGRAFVATSDKHSLPIMQIALEKRGLEIISFEDPEKLLNSIDQETDIIIVDSSFKAVEPFLFMKMIRERKDLDHLPIIYSTDEGDIFKRFRALDFGANDFIRKPFWDRELIVRVNSVVKLKRAYDELDVQKKVMEEMAMTDKLTGLYNRRFFDDTLEKEVPRSLRYDHFLSLAILNVDHFKKFNDTYGHHNGDAVLKHLGTLLHDYFRVTDIRARYRGEEFVVLMPETEVQKAASKMDSFRETVENSFVPSTCGKIQLQLTVSVGVADMKQGFSNKKDLLHQADACLYESKERGRNKVTVYGQ